MEDGTVPTSNSATPARNSFVGAAARHGNAGLSSTSNSNTGTGSAHQVSLCNTPISGASVMKNAAFMHAVNRVKSKIRAVNSGVEHYPELTGTLLSFIANAGEPLVNKDETLIQQFEMLTKKVLIQCPKFSALERILDAHGWDGVEYDVEDKACDIASLQFALGKLYYSHVWSAAPTNAGQDMSTSMPSSFLTSSGDYVNIFQDDRLIGAFCPNILYKLLSTDCIVDLFAADHSMTTMYAGLASTVGSAHELVFEDAGPGSSARTHTPVGGAGGGGGGGLGSMVKQTSMGNMLKSISRSNSIRGTERETSITPRNGNGVGTSPTKPLSMSGMKLSSDLFGSSNRTATNAHSHNENIMSPGDAKLTDIHLNRKLVFKGACVLADISGFTKLSASLCEAGLSGLDDLHNAASGFLGKYVQIVYSNKGDVISFAGDALICIFTPDEDKVLDATPRRGVDSPIKHTKAQQMAECNKRALACSLQLIEHYTEALTSHIAISCGEMSFASLGGFRNQWTYLMNGAPISELSTCIDEAGSLQVVITADVYNSLYYGMEDNETFEATKKESGNYLVKSLSINPDSNPTDQRNRYADLPQGKEISQNLKTFIPRPVLYAIASGTLDTLSELRNVTTMFLKLDTYSPEKHRDPLSLQPFFFMCQQILVKYGGFMRQFLVDDKGCVLIAMWGVPSFTYSNNCARAVSAAIAIHRGTRKLSHACSIGITNGSVFCGNIGSLIRRDFVGIGSEVNLAARYMGKAKGKIFLAESTLKSLPDDFKSQLEKSDGLTLKGVKGLSYAYIADGYMKLEIVTAGTGKSSFVQQTVRDQLVQHMNRVVPHQDAEEGSTPLHMNEINGQPSDWLRDPHKEVYSSDEIYLAIVEGSSGSGKTGISSFFVSYASKCRLYPIIITARPSDRTSMHGMLKKLFYAIVGSKRFDGDAQQKRVCKLLIEYSQLQTLEGKEEMWRLARALDLHWESIQPDEVPILSDRHYLSSMNSPAFKSDEEDITEVQKVHNNEVEDQCSVLAAVLHVLLAQEPYAIVFEDAHNYNESSWKGMYALVRTHVVGAVLITAQVSFADRDRISAQSTRSEDGGDSRGRTNSSESTKGIRNWLGSSYKGMSNYMARLSNKIGVIREEEEDGRFGSSSSPSMSREDSSGGTGVNSLKNNAEIRDESFEPPKTPPRGSPEKDLNGGSGGSGRKVYVVPDSPSRKYGASSFDGIPSSLGKRGGKQLKSNSLAPTSVKRSQSSRRRSQFVKKNDVNAHHTEAYHRMRKREQTMHIEIQPLNFEELKLLVSLESGHDEASFTDELIQIILETSSGNAFWARAIANFIMEYGPEEFLQNNNNRNNALTTLIVCRLEKLTTEQQVVLKNAAVAGEEFSTELLQFGLPRRILTVLDESLTALTEHNFIVKTAHDVPIYTFPNEVFRNILYNLTPPRERAKFHRNLAEQMEGLHAHDLEEYYAL